MTDLARAQRLLEAEERALHHPEIERMRRDPRWHTDVEHRYAGETLQQYLLALYRAFAEEEVDLDLRERLVNRVIYGNPRGIPIDSLQVLDPRTRYRMRSEGDGLGPLMPGDAVRETVPVRIDPSVPPETAAKIARAIGGLTEEKQARWLVEGGEDRHHVDGPPPNAAHDNVEAIRDALEDAVDRHDGRYYETVTAPPVLTPEDQQRVADLLDLPLWRRALRRLTGGR